MSFEHPKILERDRPFAKPKDVAEAEKEQGCCGCMALMAHRERGMQNAASAQTDTSHSRACNSPMPTYHHLRGLQM